MDDVAELSDQIRACRICADNPEGQPLPHEPRPVAVLSDQATIRIIGQAPGVRVHASGKPFTDPSGDRLRDWMGVDEDTFYDGNKVSITPMGFCFPGLDDKGGDLPPRKECGKMWQERVTIAMPQVKLALLIGMYAQKAYLGERSARTLTETVRNWKDYLAIEEGLQYIVLPHPSWRNNGWIRKNPFFANDLLPFLKKKIQEVLN